jgi:hypothetical protein
LIVGCAISLLGLERTIIPHAAGSSNPVNPALVLSVTSLRDIAVDIDEGRNVIYCYYGRASEAQPQVYVDSVRAIPGAAECKGVGVGLISRVGDVPTMMAMLRGIIEAYPELRVVSAFYKTEMLEVDGQSVRVAHALSVLRAPSIAVPTSRS